ncbi:MAG: sulfur oxidation c-type cytochrome SoxA [Burkholderiaceae bacterium]|nr:sulfur oxidation c-type cytochrome SoxA [Burkholderiaceae bacterium]
MTGSLRTVVASALALASLGGATIASAGGIDDAQRRSGFEFMRPATQAMQRDDSANPGILWVLEGEAAFRRKDGAAGRSCADCHGEGKGAMRGVAPRYPAFDEGAQRVVDLGGRVNLCRERHQRAPAFAHESEALLALGAYLGYQSRGMATAPDTDPRMDVARARGRELFFERIGQLNFSCAQCHDDRWGKRLGASLIPQAHPGGYPLYRLEWQALGSLQRRVRSCMTGVRAEPFHYGAQELIDLEAYLQWRGRGLPLEAPAVRP